MSCTVRFPLENKCISLSEGTTILQAMIDAGLSVDAPCGGSGKCKKCAVEYRFSEDDAWQRALACQTGIHRDMQVRRLFPEEVFPASSHEGHACSPDSTAEAYGAALDIGTTTIAGRLLALPSGAVLSALGRRNPQVKFGADVISRVAYAMEHGAKPLTECLRKDINDLIEQLCAEAGIRTKQIQKLCIVGNSCMHHLFLGISPECLGRAPYMPSVREGMLLKAADCGLNVHLDAAVHMLPLIAGFVGADTVGCMLAGNWSEREKTTLLIDIGTNGELVLGNKDRKIACSTAAGPALEGAKIECGMRGSRGAIDHVDLQEGKIVFHVIGECTPVGICGSGLVDLIAVLLETGELDESGRLERGRFELCENVYLTQKDVREVQLAKAAIAAGIRLLAQKAGISPDEIEEVHLAGAFGSNIRVESACAIGLIPEELRERIIPVGNAAAEGACLALSDPEKLTEADKLAEETEFLELASMPDFNDEFVDQLFFGGED